MGDRRPPRHDVAFEVMAALAGKFENTRRARQKGVELRPAFLVRHVLPVPLAIERKHRVQLESQPQGDLRRDLVRPIRQR